MSKHITVNMHDDDLALIAKLHKSLKSTHGALTVTALFRILLRNSGPK